MASYRGGEVDGHQRVWSQEEVVESLSVFELWQHVAEPRDEPGECKDGSHLGSKEKTRIRYINQESLNEIKMNNMQL